MNRPRIMLVDDHPLVREGVRHILAAADLAVVAEAGSVEEALEQAAQTRPDLLVLDLSLPGGGGLELARRIREQLPDVRILVLSVHDHPEYVLGAVRAGANGYLRKDSSPAELREAVRAVARGESFFSPAVARQLSAAVRGESARDDRRRQLERLTPREREVLAGIARGGTSKEIAQALGLSPRTVESYRESLMRKLEIRSVAGLTRFALDTGLLGQEE
ncbi:MAG TPA: response regulator transcription factor [Gemmatimonadales bacterium]|jgi:DNA-binding NarL/FixJ family response regulator|nr:response regulator transcription factor [Gemmatimonadales bacterium]